MAQWQAKTYGLTTHSSLASDEPYSSISESYYQLLLFSCGLMLAILRQPRSCAPWTVSVSLVRSRVGLA